MYTSKTSTDAPNAASDRVNFKGFSFLGLVLMHLACLLVFWLDFSWTALAAYLVMLVLRTFALTAGFHRYFSHRSFQTGRLFQFVLGWLGTAAMQRGPLWWAAHHRHHHAHSDAENDIHSPVTRGFWWSHVGWILCRRYDETNLRLIPDFAKYPELRWLDRFFLVPPLLLALTLYGAGVWLNATFPALQTTGLQMVLYGFVLSTVTLYHTTFCVNSLTHVFGRRRFLTGDQSRNNAMVALLTMGEGWHNNHHFYPASARQGFYWWEVDMTWWTLRMLAWFGIVSHLHTPPAHVYAQRTRVTSQAAQNHP
ncbi:MAG: fatty acid desaturase [Acidobacteria bacterium]|nr:fatty acid desaturase [Acidobacteriota bacterium]